MKLYHVLPEGDPLGGSRETEKVAIALRETDAEFEIINLSRERDMRPADGWYKRDVNPMGTVPALDDDGFVILESGNLLRYVADKYPQAKLLPEDPKLKARAQQWVLWENTAWGLALINLFYVHPAKEIDLAPFEAIMPFRGAKDPDLELKIAYEQVAHRLGVFDRALAGNDYIANNQYSIADIALGPHIALVSMVDVDLKPFHNVVAWLRRVGEKPAWQAEPGFIADFNGCVEKGLI